MDHVGTRMRRIIDELVYLQRTLQEALVQASHSHYEKEQPVSIGEVQDFRSAIDQMRHFLWFYVQALSHGCEGKKLIELLHQASRGDDNDARFALDPVDVSDYGELHGPLASKRKPN